jgi:ATP-dependent helicase/nuclease subunit B
MGGSAFISSASHSRIARARAWLEARQPAEEILILGGNLDAANELARDVAQARGAAFGWHRLSLAQLAALLAAPELASRGLVSVSPLGVRAICARVVHKLGADGALGRFAGIASGPGFVPALASVTTELRLAKLRPDALHDVAPDLMPLFRAYESMLVDGGFTDWAGLLALATEALANESLTRRLTHLPTLLLDVPITSDAELDFVKGLSLQAPEFIITASAADERTLGRLEKLGLSTEDLDQAVTSREPTTTIKAGSLARLQRHLFKESFEPGPPVSDDRMVIFSAPGEGRECVEITRKVLSLARGGLPFDRMAVLLRSPEQYRAPLEEAFGRANIPAHFARGAMRPAPTGRAFCVLLRCAAEGLSARRFAESLLSSLWLPRVVCRLFDARDNNGR